MPEVVGPSTQMNIELVDQGGEWLEALARRGHIPFLNAWLDFQISAGMLLHVLYLRTAYQPNN